jgi:hypothetical protein
MSYHNLPLQAIIDPIQLVLKRQHNFYLNIQHKDKTIRFIVYQHSARDITSRCRITYLTFGF